MCAITRSIEPWELSHLGAGGPDPELAGPLTTFGQFVGDWTIEECRYLHPDGTWGHLVGELHWRWILRGRAVQDVWTLVDPATGALVYEGTTIRFFDRRRNAWSSTWFSATAARVRSFTGQEIGDRIILDEQVAPGAPAERWVFSEIRAEAFRWHAEQDHHDGRGWVRTEVMRIRRTVPPRR